MPSTMATRRGRTSSTIAPDATARPHTTDPTHCSSAAGRHSGELVRYPVTGVVPADRLEAGRRERACRDAFTACPRGDAATVGQRASCARRGDKLQHSRSVSCCVPAAVQPVPRSSSLSPVPFLTLRGFPAAAPARSGAGWRRARTRPCRARAARTTAAAARATVPPAECAASLRCAGRRTRAFPRW